MKVHPVDWVARHYEDFVFVGVLIALALGLIAPLLGLVLRIAHPDGVGLLHPPSPSLHHRGPQLF
jgi:hypothetical protein